MGKTSKLSKADVSIATNSKIAEYLDQLVESGFWHSAAFPLLPSSGLHSNGIGFVAVSRLSVKTSEVATGTYAAC
jgi:hypothetical protein